MICLSLFSLILLRTRSTRKRNMWIRLLHLALGTHFHVVRTFSECEPPTIHAFLAKHNKAMLTHMHVTSCFCSHVCSHVRTELAQAACCALNVEHPRSTHHHHSNILVASSCRGWSFTPVTRRDICPTYGCCFLKNGSEAEINASVEVFSGFTTGAHSIPHGHTHTHTH